MVQGDALRGYYKALEAKEEGVEMLVIPLVDIGRSLDSVGGNPGNGW